MNKKINCEFFVGGAGISGICAAVQAGRLGMKTILVEKEMLLGGNGGPNLGVGAHATMNTNPFWNETGIMEELEERINFKGARFFPTNFGYNISPLWDTVVSEMLEEAGVTILRKHLIHKVIKENQTITGIHLINIENLSEVEILIDGYVMDATGDASIAYLADADYTMGRESIMQTGERCAPEKPDGIVSTASVTALVVDTGVPCDFVAPEATPEWNPEKPDNHFNPNQKISFLWQVDEGGESDENHPLHTPQELYRKLVYRIYSVWHYLKNIKFKEEAKKFNLIWISPILGRRESRRILGDYLLTQTDIEQCKIFEDAVGFGGSYLDEHLPSYDGGYEVRFYTRPIPYDIPFRCLYSRNIQNLFSGGRAIGVSHLAFTSTRLMRTGGLLGQAVALAAKMCMEKGTVPRGIVADYMEELRQELLKNDVWIIGKKGHDPKNMANHAVASASSEASVSAYRTANGEWESAVEGIATAVYSYPEKVDSVELFVRNNNSENTKIELFAGYGETKEIELYDVPKVEYNSVTMRYEEVKKTVHGKSIRKNDNPVIPTGSQGFATYFNRNDSVTDFNISVKSLRDIDIGFEGWISLDVSELGKLAPYDRSKFGQAMVIGVKGAVDVYINKILVDTIEGLSCKCDTWNTNFEKAPIIKILPDLVLGKADNVLNGFIHRDGRSFLHQWMSMPGHVMPQWLQLELDEEKEINEIQITFDVTERFWSDMYNMKGDKAASRCVRDFRIDILKSGEWKTIWHERDNYRRFRRISLDKPVISRCIRLVVEKVWGEEEPARVYEIRLY